MDTLRDGWPSAVAERAIGYVTRATLQGLQQGRSSDTCDTLAWLAQQILAAKEDVHRLAGEAADEFVRHLGQGGVAQAFTRELVSGLEFGCDQPMVAAARAMQILGISFCMVAGRDLRHCTCLIDLARQEGESRFEAILTAGLSDWSGLADFPPSGTPAFSK